MNIRVFKVVSAFVAAGISVSAIGMQECGSTSEVSLQSPSLIGPNAVPFEELYSPALDIEETGIVPLSRGNVTVDINDYTFIANTTFSDVVQGYGMDPEDPIIYDGGTYWISGATVCIASGDGGANQLDVGLNTGDTIIRVSYTREWSLVKLEDGTQGYVRNSFLSADEVELEPIEVATPTPTPEPTNTPTPTPVPSSDSGSSDTPTPEPEETEAEPEPTEETAEPEEEFHEAAVDYTVYASCALNTRTGPGISYTCLSTLAVGTAIEVVAVTDNGWYKSADGFYVKASLTMDTAPTPTPAPTPSSSGGGGGSSSSSSSYVGDTSSDFATFIKSFIGCRYVYGGSSPSTGFDCSGFVMYCYSTYYGISLPHGATSQSSRGYEVDPSDIQVGDIICFDRDGDGTMEHSALYVGNDTYVHAQSSATGVVASTFSSATGIAHIRRVL